MPASRALTNAALALFIKHYFSIPWLREYLLNRRVQFEIENKLCDDETISDLLFAIRMCNEWFVTAKSLSEIMTRFEDLDSEKTTSYRHGTSPFLISSYFIAHITSKMSSPDSSLSQLWRQVAMIPMEDQYKFDYYSLARKREAELVGYNQARKLWELLEKNRQSQKRCFLTDIDKATKTILEPYLTTEWKTQCKIELQHYFEDRLNYFHFLSDQARAKGNNLLADAWDQVAEEEENEFSGSLRSMIRKLIPLKAWSLARANNDTSPVRTMYGIAVHLFESGKIPLGKDALKLALNAESVLDLLRKWNSSILHLKNNEKRTSETSLIKLFDIIEKIIAHFQQQLVIHLESARADNLNDWKTFLEVLKWKVLKQKEDYDSHYSKFQQTVVKFQQFSLTLQKYEHFIGILRTRMDEYRSDLITYFKQEFEISRSLQSPSIVSSGFAPNTAPAFHSQFFLWFPYEKELLTYVEKLGGFSEPTGVSALIQEVVDEILNSIGNTFLSPTNIEIYRKHGFKRHPYSDRYFIGLFEVLEWLSLDSNGQPTSQQELSLVTSFIHCYRDLIQFRGTDSKKSDKLYSCLAGIWDNRIAQEKNVPELLMIWRKILQYFQKSNSSSSSSSIPEEKKTDKELQLYQKQVYHYAGMQLIIQVGLITNTRQSSLSSLLGFVTEVATYLEQDRLFEANFTFLRGALSFLSAGGETTPSSSSTISSLQVENLSIVDPWIGTWNSVVVKIFPVLLDEIYGGILYSREENILILNFLYEAMVCVLNQRYVFYKNWLLFVQELLIMRGKSASKNVVAFRSLKSLKDNTALLTHLQVYAKYVSDRKFTRKIEIDDLKRIASMLHMDTDDLAGNMQNALNLFYQGLKIFELDSNQQNTDHSPDHSEDEVYPFFRLSSLYLKLHELSPQQTTTVSGNEEEIQSLSGKIQEFIDEHPEVKFFISETSAKEMNIQVELIELE
jgi:hypothetical protein